MKNITCLFIACAAASCSPGNAADEENVAGADISAAGEVGGGENRVASSGKTDIPLAEVPEQVLAAARAAHPGFTVTAAEAETREGRRYFDIGGTLADGAEVEFDIMEEDGSWTVVETQRDIAFAAAPEQVRHAHAAGFAPKRVIESTQADGLIIYELYGELRGDPEGQKVEIKWDGRHAEVLDQEWAH